MGKYHAYVLASRKHLGRFRERLTTKSDWAVTAALTCFGKSQTIEAFSIFKSKKTNEPKYREAASVGGLSDGNPAEAGLFAITVWVLRLFMRFSHVN